MDRSTEPWCGISTRQEGAGAFHENLDDPVQPSGMSMVQACSGGDNRNGYSVAEAPAATDGQHQTRGFQTRSVITDALRQQEIGFPGASPGSR
jgi:hypothetical protein